MLQTITLALIESQVKNWETFLISTQTDADGDGAEIYKDKRTVRNRSKIAFVTAKKDFGPKYLHASNNGSYEYPKTIFLE